MIVYFEINHMTVVSMFELNPHVLNEAKQTLSKTNFCRIKNVFPSEQAKLLKSQLEKTHFKLALTQNGQPQSYSHEQLSLMTPSQRNAMFTNVHKNAARGIGFMYGRDFITEQSAEVFKLFLQYWNSDKLLATFSETSGQAIVRATAQATCYDKGYFLTRHNDVVPAEGRIYAYVLSMTENWHPDWGGLLQFYQKDGAPTRSYSPIFNSLTIFDVTQIHAVTYVTPFAATKRLSMTGWFRVA